MPSTNSTDEGPSDNQVLQTPHKGWRMDLVTELRDHSA